MGRGHRHQERGVALVFGGVDRRPLRQEQFGDAFEAVLGRSHQGCFPVVIARVRFRLPSQEQFGHGFVPAGRRNMQWGVRDIIRGGQVRTVGQEKLRHDQLASRGRRMQRRSSSLRRPLGVDQIRAVPDEFPDATDFLFLLVQGSERAGGCRREQRGRPFAAQDGDLFAAEPDEHRLIGEVPEDPLILHEGIVRPAQLAVALAQAKDGRIHILGEMAKALTGARSELGEHAPRIEVINIPTDKIREVIGQGGKVIREIVEKTGAKIDIQDDGTVKVASANGESIRAALKWIKSIVAEPEVGEIYEGKVVKVMDFGAFVNFLGARDGLVHISQLSPKKVAKTGDVVKEGDKVFVKLLGFDDRGKVRLSMKIVDQATGKELAQDPNDKGE